MLQITTPALQKYRWVRHAFFTRTGSLSTDYLNYALNSQDKLLNTAANYARAMAIFSITPENLIMVKQEHTTSVLTIESSSAFVEPPFADALVTKIPGVALGILSADCAPVLFFSQRERLVGAAHVGWRGALHGILTAIVSNIYRLGTTPSDIITVIGPCIAQDSYTVGPEFLSEFLNASQDNIIFFKKISCTRYYTFNLSQYIARQLIKLGISTVIRVPFDTLREDNYFFSYRRLALHNSIEYGRNLSFIMLEQ